MTKRDGISFTEQLLCTPDDEANRKYFVALPNAEDEDMAHSMADVIYGACADGFADDITKEEADAVWRQNLADARRMVCEPEYMDIFWPCG